MNIDLASLAFLVVLLIDIVTLSRYDKEWEWEEKYGRIIFTWVHAGIWFIRLSIPGRWLGNLNQGGRWIRLLNKISALIIRGSAFYIGLQLLK